MIYIDPPYNTGKDFVYKDNFRDNLANYQRLTGQRDEEGNPLTTNSDSDGRYHSNWLNMMYPRLKLARNLLTDDGVIFISIHDKEVHNLRKISDEIFGEENFLACLIWDKNHSAQAGIFKIYHEYVLVYAKKQNIIKTPRSRNNDLFEAGAMKRESPRHPLCEFKFPAGVRFDAVDGTELTGEWGGVEKVFLLEGRMVAEDRKTKYPVTLKAAYTQRNQMEQYFYGDRNNLVDSRNQKIVEFFFNSSGKLKILKERGVETPQTTLKNYGSQGTISTALGNLFGLEASPLDNPKPIQMMSDFIIWFTSGDDIVLDFFAGSATSAHAVMQLNAEDGGNRKFIMIQLPEQTAVNSNAYQAGYQTICDIGKERIRRAAAKIRNEHPETDIDLGFKVFKLDTSNLKKWQSEGDNLEADLLDAVDNILPDRSNQDLLYEVLIKYGLPLTYPVEEIKIANHTIFNVANGSLIACFDEGIDLETVQAIADLSTEEQPVLRVVFRDTNFVDDIVKTNAIQRLLQAGIEDVLSI
ncbi:hypothetical protein AAEX37_01412 [Oligella sp. MSHR50489EDL]|uniref:site-specific DNA-methyltransferase n=1 Tax=Oligella sp. MSHR50489EDL TaxID=3139409 RepID=UPI003D81C44F